MNKLKYLSGVVSLQLDRTKCIGCRECLNVCPHQVFILFEKKAAIGDRDSCMECGACALNCSTQAISVRKGVGCAQGIINGLMRGTKPTCDCSGGASSCC